MAVIAKEGSVSVGRDSYGSITNINGLDKDAVGRMLDEKLSRIAEQKGVPEPPLRSVLAKLGAMQVPLAEIPARLDAAADELIRLRADLARLRNDRPEFAAIRARASGLIDQGEFDAARAVLREGREVARALREEISRSEAGFLADEARIDRLQLNHDAARAKFAEAARLNPDDCWVWIELGDLWTLLGSLAEAETAFRAARRAAAENGDERDLSVSFNKVGDVLVAQGNLPEAEKTYRDSLAIRDRLAKSDPGHAGWQRDLSVSFNKVGDVLVAQGNLPEALKTYRDSLAIRDRLAKSDPGNAGWQRDLSVSFANLAGVSRKMGASADALSAFRQGRAIIVRMTNLSPDNAVWKNDLAWFDEQIKQMQ